MRYVVLFLLLSQPLLSQTAASTTKQNCGCAPNANLLYQRVIRAMWEQDEGEHPYVSANGFIRIAIHPAWDSEYFFDVRLNRTGVPAITAYTLPSDAKTVTILIQKALNQEPCANAQSIAKTIPVRRNSIQPTKEVEALLDEFFSVRIAPRRIPDEIRLDATVYELEFVGNDTFLFNSDDSNAALAKWMQSFVKAIRAADRQS